MAGHAAHPTQRRCEPKRGSSRLVRAMVRVRVGVRVSVRVRARFWGRVWVRGRVGVGVGLRVRGAARATRHSRPVCHREWRGRPPDQGWGWG